MPQRLKEVDVVVIGLGMVGSIVAKELAAAGYKVVGLERGQPHFTVREFQSPAVHYVKWLLTSLPRSKISRKRGAGKMWLDFAALGRRFNCSGPQLA